MTDEDQNSIPNLSARDAEQLATHLSEVARDSIPLDTGLLAAAEEAGNRRIARALRSIAAALQRGQSVEEVLSQAHGRLPRHIGGLVAAAARTGKFSEALSQFVDHHQAVRQLRRSVSSALAYPLLVVVATLLMLMVGAFFFVPQFDEMYRDLELELPKATLSLLWWAHTGLPILLALAGGLLIALLGLRLFGGAAIWRRAFATVPVFGPLGHWAGVAEWTRLLGILVEQQVPLPDALRLAADGLHDANLREVSHGLAQDASQGRELSDLIGSTYRLPPLLVPFVSAGEQTRSLSGALLTLSDLYVERVRQRAALYRSILPPVLFILVGFLAVWVIGGLMLPLIALVDAIGGF